MVECCKWGLMGYPSRTLKYSSAESIVDHEEPFMVSEGNNISKWVRENCCNLARHVTGFCPSHNIMSESKLISFVLIFFLAKEILRQPSNDTVLWLLVITFMHIYNDKKQARQTQVQNVPLLKCKMYHLRRQRIPRNLILEPKLILEEISGGQN